MDDQKPVDPQATPQTSQQPSQTNGQAPEYTNKDLQRPMREIAQDTQTPPPPPVQPTTEAPKVEVDLEKLKTDWKQEVLQDIEREKQAQLDAEAAKAKEAEPTAEEKSYLEWEKQFNQSNSRPPTYLEAMKFVEEQAVAKIEQRQVEKQQQQETEQKKVQEEVQARDKILITAIEDERADMYKAGMLTPVKDPNNPSDQGVVEWNSLVNKWIEINNQRRQENLPEISSATRIAQFYWQKPNAQPAGADAPIAGNRGSSTPPSAEQSYTYEDIRKPWNFFRRG